MLRKAMSESRNFKSVFFRSGASHSEIRNGWQRRSNGNHILKTMIIIIEYSRRVTIFLIGQPSIMEFTTRFTKFSVHHSMNLVAKSSDIPFLHKVSYWSYDLSHYFVIGNKNIVIIFFPILS